MLRFSLGKHWQSRVHKTYCFPQAQTINTLNSLIPNPSYAYTIFLFSPQLKIIKSEYCHHISNMVNIFIVLLSV